MRLDRGKVQHVCITVHIGDITTTDDLHCKFSAHFLFD